MVVRRDWPVVIGPFQTWAEKEADGVVAGAGWGLGAGALLLGTKRTEPMCTVVDVSKGGDLKLLGKGCDLIG